jgi:hypothetical protein
MYDTRVKGKNEVDSNSIFNLQTRALALLKH